MSQNQDLQSYKTFKSYLDSIDVDTSNMDNDTLDYQYLQRLRKRNGEALSTQEQREGGITLKQYFADAQALQDKNKAIAQAENDARQETAYNDYVNSKLAKYLNIAEENNGTAGYTGITEGNRIALANQEKNIASNIQNTKQNAISQYLSDYNNALMDNSKYALDQMTEMQSTFDQENKKIADANKDTLESDIVNMMLNKYKPTNEDGTEYYDVGVLNEIKDYINKSNVDDTTKQELMKRVESMYNWKDYKQINRDNAVKVAQDIINGYTPSSNNTYGKYVLENIVNRLNQLDIDDATKQEILNEIKSKYSFEDASGVDTGLKIATKNNNKELKDATNVLSRKFTITDGDKTYSITSSKSIYFNGGNGILGDKNYKDYSKYLKNMPFDSFVKLQDSNGEWQILYKRHSPSSTNGDEQWVIFREGNDALGKNGDGFNVLLNRVPQANKNN